MDSLLPYGRLLKPVAKNEAYCPVSPFTTYSVHVALKDYPGRHYQDRAADQTPVNGIHDVHGNFPPLALQAASALARMQMKYV